MARKPEGWTLSVDPRTGNYLVRFRTDEGRRVMRSTGTRDRREAQAQAARIVREEVGRTRRVERGRTRLDEAFLALWIADYSASHSRETADAYESYGAVHWMSRWSVIEAIDPSAYVRDRLGVVTASTVRKETSALRSFLSWCVERGHLRDAPSVPSVPKRATGTRYDGGRRTPRRVDLSPETVERIIAALPEETRRGHPARDAVALIWDTTLRIATIERLERPRHYRPGAERLTITADIDKARMARDLPLSPRARAILDRRATRDGPIFGPLELRYALERAALAAGVPEGDAPRVSPHDLRHAAITAVLSAPGSSIAGAGYLAGHRHASTTALYVHPGIAAAEAALAARIGIRSGIPTTAAEPAGDDDGADPSKK